METLIWTGPGLRQYYIRLDSQSDCRGCLEDSTVRGTELGEKKALVSPPPQKKKTALCLNCAVRTVYQLGPINEHSATQTNLSELRTALLGNQVVFATLLLTYAVRSNSLSGHYDSVLPTVH